MAHRPGDEPTRPRSTHQHQQRQHAQSSDGTASTPSLPGRSSPPQPTASARAVTTSSSLPASSSERVNPGVESASAVPAGAAAAPTSPHNDVVDKNGGKNAARAADHGLPVAAHDAGAVREEGTAGDIVREPGGTGLVEDDDTALSTANDREATELATMPSRVDTVSTVTTATDQCSERERRTCQLSRQRVGWTDVVGRWWRRNVSVTVAASGMRDHLALERTFLGYLRTSIALSMTGVIIAQLMRFQHAPNPDPRFGYYVLGKPLAVVFIVAAIIVVALGAIRFWRQQNAMVRGKVHAGGWEILAIMAGSLL
ncbi:hypothetical protein SLS57_003577 [Botryosphaeria dothidea]